jgi:hypothetical protein
VEVNVFYNIVIKFRVLSCGLDFLGNFSLWQRNIAERNEKEPANREQKAEKYQINQKLHRLKPPVWN